MYANRQIDMMLTRQFTVRVGVVVLTICRARTRVSASKQAFAQHQNRLSSDAGAVSRLVRRRVGQGRSATASTVWLGGGSLALHDHRGVFSGCPRNPGAEREDGLLVGPALSCRHGWNGRVRLASGRMCGASCGLQPLASGGDRGQSRAPTTGLSPPLARLRQHNSHPSCQTRRSQRSKADRYASQG